MAGMVMVTTVCVLSAGYLGSTLGEEHAPGLLQHAHGLTSQNHRTTEAYDLTLLH